MRTMFRPHAFPLLSTIAAVGDLNGDSRPDVLLTGRLFVQRPVPMMAESLRPRSAAHAPGRLEREVAHDVPPSHHFGWD
jgi:hypothetical protein